jgi:SpoVK/Ycf46/Vps4 family AAA+-type ATPase
MATENSQVEASQFATSAHYSSCMEELSALVKGHAPLIWVITHEETRFIDDLERGLAEKEKRQVWLWSSYQGLVRSTEVHTTPRATGENAETWAPARGLTRMLQLPEGSIIVLRDFHTVLAEPIPRQMRDMYEALIDGTKTLIITAPLLAHGAGGSKAGLPPTLEKQISVLRYELPNKEQIMGRVGKIVNVIKSTAKSDAKKQELTYGHDQIETFARALQGLTLHEIDTSISTSFTHLGKLEIDKLIADKRQILRKTEILEFIDASVNVKDIGGLDFAKTYLAKYGKAHTDEAKSFGVEPLKGVLLTGVPGTGKSLLAKAIGKLWGVPLLRLDVGKVMTGLVGGSEGKMREVIDQAQSMAPCILWIDEVEKSLAGTKSSNFSDGGTLARVFGTLLTAMQDGLEGVTIIATANDITMLPPEFIRRFNEVFFVDLPGPDERWEILGIHLAKRNRNINDFTAQKKELLAASEGYTGAEIEKAVKDAIAAAFYNKGVDISHKDLVKALAETKPISKVMAKKIETLRSKAKGTYRFASSWAEEQLKNLPKHSVTTKNGKKLDLDDAIDDLGVFAKTKKEKASTTPMDSINRFDKLLADPEEKKNV